MGDKTLAIKGILLCSGPPLSTHLGGHLRAFQYLRLRFVAQFVGSSFTGFTTMHPQWYGSHTQGESCRRPRRRLLQRRSQEHASQGEQTTHTGAVNRGSFTRRRLTMSPTRQHRLAPLKSICSPVYTYIHSQKLYTLYIHIHIYVHSVLYRYGQPFLVGQPRQASRRFYLLLGVDKN